MPFSRAMIAACCTVAMWLCWFTAGLLAGLATIELVKLDFRGPLVGITLAALVAAGIGFALRFVARRIAQA